MKVPKIAYKKNVEEGSICVDPNKFGDKSFYPNNLQDKKILTKFIKAAESVARKSTELKAYIQYLKDEVDMSSCLFFNNLDMKDVTIELHHYPFTLYDVVEIITNNFIRNKYPLSTFSVAFQVVKLHYENMIGLVPLSKTVHDLVHAGRVYIPMQAVFGNVSYFLEAYHEDMSQEILERLKTLITTSKEKMEQLNSILTEKIIYNELPETNILGILGDKKDELPNSENLQITLDQVPF